MIHSAARVVEESDGQLQKLFDIPKHIRVLVTITFRQLYPQPTVAIMSDQGRETHSTPQFETGPRQVRAPKRL